MIYRKQHHGKKRTDFSTMTLKKKKQHHIDRKKKRRCCAETMSFIVQQHSVNSPILKLALCEAIKYNYI